MYQQVVLEYDYIFSYFYYTCDYEHEHIVHVFLEHVLRYFVVKFEEISQLESDEWIDLHYNLVPLSSSQILLIGRTLLGICVVQYIPI